jgi:hypothetical protein
MAAGIRSLGAGPLRLLRSVGGQLLLAVAVTLGAGALFQIWQSQAWDRENIERGERDRLRAVAAAAAANISGEQHEAAALASPGQDAFTTWAEAPPDAVDIHARLERVQARAGFSTPIYTLRVREEAQAAVLASPDQTHADAMEFIATSAEAPYWRHRYAYRPEMAGALLRGEAAATAPYEDKHGVWLSAYAPILDADGGVVAILEVDAPFSQLQAAHHARLNRQIALVAGVGVGGFFLLVLIARRFAGGFQLIERAARRLGEGDLATPCEAGNFGEVAHLTAALEQARSSLAARAARVQAEAEALLQQRDLALRGIDDASLRRREALKEAAEVVRAAVQFGSGVPTIVRLADLGYQSASILAAPTIDLAAGTPLTLHVGNRETGQRARVPATVVGRTEHSPTLIEYDLRVNTDSRFVSFPQPVDRIMNGRAAMRVRPSRKAPVSATLVIGAEPLRCAVEDLSVTGMSLTAPCETGALARAGTQLRIDIHVPNRAEPICFDVRVARIQALEDGGTRVGVQLVEGTGGGLAHRQQALGEYVAARHREMVATSEAAV